MKESKTIRHRICGKVLASMLAITMLASFTSVGASAATATATATTSVVSTSTTTTKTSVAIQKTADFEYYKNSNGTITINKYIGTKTEVVIPLTIGGKKVTRIGDSAFLRNGKKVTKITIPNTVTYIGNKAFQYCSKLSGIVLPNSVTYIGESAFGTCSSLKQINIPDGVTFLKKHTFYGCKNLKTISGGNGLLGIEKDTLEHSLWYDNKPNGVVYLGKALYNYKGKMPNNTTISIKFGTMSICDEAFYGKAQLVKVIIPSSVKRIGDHAFYNCKALKSLSIPNSVKSIEKGAFEYCQGLTKISIPDSVVAVKEYAFYGCKKAESITIGKGITSIGDKAFEDCQEVKTVTLGNNVKSIGKYAFCNCYKLNAITIPKSVSSIGEYAFDSCAKYAKMPANFEGSINGINSIGKPKIIIRGYKGSYAEKYANAKGIRFQALLDNTSTVSTTSINLGKTVTLKGSATGGTSPYTYAYYYKKTSSTQWTTAKAYSTAKSFAFKPASKGTYDVYIKVKDLKGTVVSKSFKITVK